MKYSQSPVIIVLALILALAFFSTSCSNLKFKSKGKTDKKAQAKKPVTKPPTVVKKAAAKPEKKSVAVTEPKPKPRPKPKPEPKPKPGPEPKPRPELIPDRFLGDWKAVKVNGKPVSGMTWKISKTVIKITAGENVNTAVYEVIPDTNPLRILTKVNDKLIRRVIGKFENNMLFFKTATTDGGGYAKDFEPEEGYSLFELEPVK
ncbi:MAG: hypothetical protein ACYS8W_05735 [Planctomycetota bacterium]|jgi:hypothetical protein